MSLKNNVFIFSIATFFLSGFVFAFQYIENSEKNKFIIAFGADADQNKPQPIWETILSTQPDLFLFLGDNVYIDSGEENIMRAKYAQLGRVSGYYKLIEKGISIIATWDDHDFGQDNAGGDFPYKKISKKVFLDFFLEPQDSIRRKREGIYDAKTFRVSDRIVQIIALDTRYFRSPLKNNDLQATLLGDAQWEWLKAELLEPADVRIVMSSIQVIAKDHGYEKWMNFPQERERLFRLIRETKANGVIFLSGDRHFAELSAINAGVGYPLYELTAGSLNKAKKKMLFEKNSFRMKDPTGEESFGLLALDFEYGKTPSIIMEIKNLEAQSIIQRKIYLSELQRGVLP